MGCEWKPNLVAILCCLDDRMAEESEELAMIAEKARALLNRQERQVYIHNLVCFFNLIM